jgi:hypothetical protein
LSIAIGAAGSWPRGAGFVKLSYFGNYEVRQVGDEEATIATADAPFGQLIAESPASGARAKIAED